MSIEDIATLAATEAHQKLDAFFLKKIFNVSDQSK
jgi:hypothetical protein